jgi:acyl-CoA synthetase (AMP-forming)/AMP-acid ligase II/acyl carrier protein
LPKNEDFLHSPFDSVTLVELLSRRARSSPDQRSFTFLSDGEIEEAHLTYGELDRRARAIGASLQSVVEQGARALLIYPPNLEFIQAFFGCLYGGVIAVPTYPPQTRARRSLEKLRTIIQDVQPTVILTTSSLTAAVESLFALAQEELATTRLITTDTIALDQADAWQPPAINSDTLAFVQYTSGSTGLPKGVMLTHRNLLFNLSLIHDSFDVNTNFRAVTWLPPYHDMGLIGVLIEAVYAGVPNTVMAPAAFLQRPIRWLEAIVKTGATVSGAPNFAYDLCVRRITPDQIAGLDLSKWDLAFCGAETIRLETFERFVEAFAPCGFRRDAFFPCYGLAEATLMVTASQKGAPLVTRTVQTDALAQNCVVSADAGAEGARTIVSCGQPASGQNVEIVDPDTLTPCPSDRVGEIWVSGPCVAQGYWQRPQETADTFQAHLADSGEGPFLRTGDLGFLQDGHLYVTGRLKDLIIIRGRNHYPQDIELTVERSHEGLRAGCGVAFSLDVDGEERLAIVQEVERRYWKADFNEMAESIRQAVAEEHELQVYAIAFIKTGSIPKTSSGKLQRRASREKFLAHDLELLGEWTLALEDHWHPLLSEENLGDGRRIREELLAVDVPTRQQMLENYIREKIASSLQLSLAGMDVQQPLNSLGIDSLTAMELKGWIEAELGVEVPITLFLQEPSIAQFSTQLLDQLIVTAAASSQPLAVDTDALNGHHASIDGVGVMSSQEAEQLLMQIDQLSDAEVDALLNQISLAEDASLVISSSAGNGNGGGNGNGLSSQEAEQLLANLDHLSDVEVEALLRQMAEKETLE